MAARSALLVSAVEEDHEFLGRVFWQQGWALYKTRTLESALVLLNHCPVPVVITERELPLGNWKDLLAATRKLLRAPLLIVTDRQADEQLWAEVLNLGGHDVLGQPFQVAELLWVLNTAWRIGEDQMARAPQAGSKVLSASAQSASVPA
jgi:DNA-binding response OmpR family regulator